MPAPQQSFLTGQVIRGFDLVTHFTGPVACGLLPAPGSWGMDLGLMAGIRVAAWVSRWPRGVFVSP